MVLKGRFGGFISKTGVRYSPDAIPEEVRQRLAKMVIDYDRQKITNSILHQIELSKHKEAD